MQTNSQLLYQLTLDFDIYVENPVKKVSLEDMNERIFEIYKNSLTERFLNNLLNEKFSSKEIFKIWFLI